MKFRKKDHYTHAQSQEKTDRRYLIQAPLNQTANSNLASPSQVANESQLKKRLLKQRLDNVIYVIQQLKSSEFKKQKITCVNQQNNEVFLVIEKNNAKQREKYKYFSRTLTLNQQHNLAQVCRIEKKDLKSINKVKIQKVFNILEFQRHKLRFNLLNRRVLDIKILFFSILELNFSKNHFQPYFATLTFLLSKFQRRWRAHNLETSFKAIKSHGIQKRAEFYE